MASDGQSPVHFRGLPPADLDDQHLPRDQRVQIHCEAFAQQWHSELRPRIEDSLAQAPAGDREPLLRAILTLELTLRSEGGESIDGETYRKRFAENSDVVDAVLAGFREERREQPEDLTTVWTTLGRSTGNESFAPSVSDQLPKRIGRYEVRRVLGRGGFAVVYLAYDTELHRQVALKLPLLDHFNDFEAVDLFVNEARAVARLDHPGIVRVYDVQREAGLVYIVQQFIDGGHLASYIENKTLSSVEIASLMIDVTEAVGYAHSRGCWHRDLKPANLLVDSRGKPYVADFGLALHESTQRARIGEVAGTYHYMSPEQARGESHRLDGRSDIWSLGVILYELLTRQRPFAGTSRRQVLEEIQYRDPKPPRMVSSSIPRELCRICLACLAKRATDRYQTAADLADDLRHWVRSATSTDREAALSDSSDHSNRAAVGAFIPRGLRSFETGDADFFLSLLPGPHDRDGLPKRVRFWKTQIEKTEAEETFPVGLMYGPSGCGKSSLVKAGLLPRLSSTIVAIYVEATADGLESRLIRQLARACPELAHSGDLPQLIASLRERGGYGGRKILLVIDQFEQWLHGHENLEDGDLLRALRQCDGAGVQCLLMVRDDFYVSINRFFRQLEIRIAEDHNSALVDLFDVSHAEKVLTAFGCAYGKLPDSPAELSSAQKRFITQAVAGLAEGGKIISVQIALFAEMMKSWTWTEESLRAVGGTSGIGVAFLDETFLAKTAPPTHRLHQGAIRAVLRALLPSPTTTIRGRMKSYGELLAVSGCRDRSDFDAVLEILDGEVRLITPTEPGEASSDAGNTAAAPPIHEPGDRYYQLTHDFLIGSLREWLTREQQESRRGRAELRLAERAQLWHARPEPKQLPSWFEWISALLFTDPKTWSLTETAVVKASTAFYSRRMLLLVLLAATSVWGVAAGNNYLRSVADQQYALSLLERLRTGRVDHLPQVLEEMAPHQQFLLPLLEEMRNASELDTRWRAALALHVAEPSQTNFLREAICQPSLHPQELLLTRDLLAPTAAESSRWAEQAIRTAPRARFRVACALAGWDPSHPVLIEYAEAISEELVQQPLELSSEWCAALYPARSSLRAALRNSFHQLQDPEHVSVCADAIYTFADGDVQTLVDLLPAAEQTQAGALLAVLQTSDRVTAATSAGVLLRKWEQMTASSESDQDRIARGVANLAVAQWVLGDPAGIRTALQDQEDPRVRTYTEVALAGNHVSADQLAELLSQASDDMSVQHGVLVAMTDRFQELPSDRRQRFVRRVEELYRNAPSPGIHSTCQQILERLGRGEWLARIHTGYDRAAAQGLQWHDAPNQHTMVHLRMDRRLVGMSTKEVSVEQFKQFLKTHEQTPHEAPDIPAATLHIFQAIQYCQWLSEKEYPPEQWCYPPASELSQHNMDPVDNYLDRRGYRLPTVEEWQFGCRAGTVTPRFYGSDPTLLARYAWDVDTSHGNLAPVATLLPNRLGFFDMYGNVKEMCHLEIPRGEMKFSACGSMVRSKNAASVSDFQSKLLASIRNADPHLGFRIARTLSP